MTCGSTRRKATGSQDDAGTEPPTRWRRTTSAWSPSSFPIRSIQCRSPEPPGSMSLAALARAPSRLRFGARIRRRIAKGSKAVLTRHAINHTAFERSAGQRAANTLLPEMRMQFCVLGSSFSVSVKVPSVTSRPVNVSSCLTKGRRPRCVPSNPSARRILRRSGCVRRGCAGKDRPNRLRATNRHRTVRLPSGRQGSGSW